MNGGAPRLVVVVVAVLAGILILTKGFEGSATPITPPDGDGVKTTAPATTSPSPTGTGSTIVPTGGDGGPTPQQKGVVIAIYNATSTNGLACSAETSLKKKGYVIKATGNFPATIATTIYFRGEKGGQGDVDAQLLKSDGVTEGKIKKLPSSLPSGSDIPKEAELVIVLGTDYAANHPVPPTC
jgi:hypothetical protein